MISKFIIAGVFNTGFYYLLYVVLIFLQVNYTIAIMMATVATMFVSYKTFGKYVFCNGRSRSFYRFVMVTIINYLLSVMLVFILSQFELNYYLAGLVATLVVAVNSYTLNKFFVFKEIKL